MSGDEDELEMYPRKFFDIGALPTDMDKNAVPTSGLDYLRQVKLELSRCPEVVRVEIDEKLLKKQPTIKVNCNYLTPAPPGFGPTEEWQTEQITDFFKLRQELLTEKPKMQKKFPRKEMPNIRDIAAWRSFCLGDDGRSDSEAQGPSKDNRVSFDQKTRRGKSKGAPPLLSSLIWLIQPDIEILLSHHLQWLQKLGFSDQQGRWIYSLMALLEKPLTPNACDVLRKLAHTCSELRSKLESKEDPTLPAVNLIICLVANYFDQKDMKDMANVKGDESLLSRQETLAGDDEEEDDDDYEGGTDSENCTDDEESDDE